MWRADVAERAMQTRWRLAVGCGAGLAIFGKGGTELVVIVVAPAAGDFGLVVFMGKGDRRPPMRLEGVGCQFDDRFLGKTGSRQNSHHQNHP